MGDDHSSVADRIALVDGNNLLIRGWHAAAGSQMSAHGVETGSVVIFIRTLSKMVRAIKPTRIAVCWDGGHAYRSKLFPEYKAGRLHASQVRMDDPENHFRLTKRFLSLANIHHVEMPGVEADDLIAHYWRQRGDAKIFIVSGDQDMYQLLDDGVEQWRPMNKAEIDVMTHDRVVALFNCEPEKLSYLKAITGDSSDAIPGVPQLGPSRAQKILAECEWDWRHTLEHPKIVEHRDIVLRNFSLVNLREANFNMSFPSPPLFLPVESSDELAKFFEEYEMHALARDYQQGSLWADLDPGLHLDRATA